MALRTTFHNNVTTPIPNNVDHQTIVVLLHDHDLVIHLSPIVTKFKERDRDGDKVNFDVWENVDLLPFGLWKHEIQFTASFQDKVDGVISWLEAPLGLTSQSTYTVHPKSVPGSDGEPDGGTEGGWVLEEAIESSCSVFLRPLIEPQLLSARNHMYANQSASCIRRMLTPTLDTPP